MLDIKKMIAGAVSGFVAALVVDINAWARSTGKYDFWLASKRWVAGAISGAAAAVGVSALG